MPKKSSEYIEIVLRNYELSFSAMRAYHVSEIEHKKEIISVYNSIVIAIGAIYAAVFGLLPKLADNNQSTSWMLLLLLTSLIITIVGTICIQALSKKYITKITKENDRYEKFRNECIISRKILGLNKIPTDYLKTKCSKVTEKEKNELFYWANQVTTMEEKSERTGTGFIGAINIVRTYSRIAIAIFLLVFTIVSLMFCAKVFTGL